MDRFRNDEYIMGCILSLFSRYHNTAIWGFGVK